VPAGFTGLDATQVYFRSMRRQQPSTPDVQISGDTLALDPAIRKRINAEAKRLKQRHPTIPVSLRVGINEEFDQKNGHRVRCELAAELPGRRQIMVREAQKEAFGAISVVFATAKKQLRRLSSRAVQDRETNSTNRIHTAKA
jgi:ribosome-associated translation inhibitor RaiA